MPKPRNFGPIQKAGQSPLAGFWDGAKILSQPESSFFNTAFTKFQLPGAGRCSIMPPMSYGIGGVVRRRRRELKLTQHALAELIGVARTMVNKWERGDSRP